MKRTASQHRLQGADGAGGDGTGTGITIQPGGAEDLQWSRVDLSLEKALQIAIVQCGKSALNQKSQLSAGKFSFFIQFRYTPDRFLPLFPKRLDILLEWRREE